VQSLIVLRALLRQSNPAPSSLHNVQFWVGSMGFAVSGPAADSNFARFLSTIPVGMSLRSPKKLAVEGIQENHMGTKAQTLSPNDCAAGTGVMAPECTSQLESGVMDARVVAPEKISKLAVEVNRTGVLHEAVESIGVPALDVGVVAGCMLE